MREVAILIRKNIINATHCLFFKDKGRMSIKTNYKQSFTADSQTVRSFDLLGLVLDAGVNSPSS